MARLYQGGYQSGVSVGFRPIQYEIRRDPRTGESVGIVFLEQELLEISAAPVPANENALRKALDAAPPVCGATTAGPASSGERSLRMLFPRVSAPTRAKVG